MKIIRTIRGKTIKLLTAFTLLGPLMCPVLVGQSWFHNNWQFRIPVTITNDGDALTDYQVKLVLNESFSWNNAKNDGSDIRLTTSDGTEIACWIEGWAPPESATIWFNSPSIPSGTSTVYLYYGNPSALSASNGEGTFRLFDDFESWSQQSSPLWTSSGESYVFPDGSAKFQGNYGLVIRQNTDVGMQQFVQSVEGFGSDFVLDFDWQVTDIGGIGAQPKPYGLVSLTEIDPSGSLVFYNMEGTPAVIWNPSVPLATGTWNRWHKTSVVRHGNNSKVVFDGNLTESLNAPSGGDGQIRFGVMYATTQYLDNIRIRQYAEPEPITQPGSEELNGKRWIGAAKGDWGLPENWDPIGIPANTDNVIIPAGSDVLVTTGNPNPSAMCNNLIIGPTAELTIGPGGDLTVGGGMKNNGELLITSGSTTNGGSLIVAGTSIGNVKFHRLLRRDTEYPQINDEDRHFFSSPVGGMSVEDFFIQNSPGYLVDGLPVTWGGIEIIGSVYQFWKYQELDDTWPIVSSGILESGRGYNIDRATNDGHTRILRFEGSVVKNASFTCTSPYANYNGNPRTNSFDYGEGNTDPLIWSGSRKWTDYGGGGWNLLGNPFTSHMDAIAFINANAGKFDPHYQALYIYDGINNVYKWVGESAPGYPSGIGEFGRTSDHVLQTAQGFFVLALYDQIEFIFNSTMQVHGNRNVELLKSATPDAPWPGLKLKVKSGEMENSTIVVYNENMTLGLDPGFDIGQLSTFPEVDIYTTLIEKDIDVNFACQALPVIGSDKIIVPVGIDSEKGGEVTFSGIAVPMGDYRFWLEDRVVGVFTDIFSKSYTVTLPPESYGTGRFFIIASINTPDAIDQPGSPESGLRIWPSNGKVILTGKVNEGAICEVFDLNGSRILITSLDGDGLNMVDLPAGLRGVFIVRVINGQESISKKIVLL